MINIVVKDVQTNLRNIKKWKKPKKNHSGIEIFGHISKEFDGFYHFLVQAKIELWNINIVQLYTNLKVSKSNNVSESVCPFLKFFSNHFSSNLELVKKNQIFEKLNCANEAFNFQEIKKIVQINESKYIRHRLRYLEF